MRRQVVIPKEETKEKENQASKGSEKKIQEQEERSKQLALHFNQQEEIFKQQLKLQAEKIHQQEERLKHQEERKIKQEELQDSKALVRLDPTTIKVDAGSTITVSENGLWARKNQTSHCAVCSSSPFKTGVHGWKVTTGNRQSWSEEHWLAIGVHTNPHSALTHPAADNGIYGLSISASQNFWIILGGKCTYTIDSLNNNAIVYNEPPGNCCLINPGDTVHIVLDCDNGTISYTHPKWKIQLQGIPKNTDLYPYFDPYDCDFLLKEK